MNTKVYSREYLITEVFLGFDPSLERDRKDGIK